VSAIVRWLLPPVPLRRIAILRAIIYPFLLCDVLLVSRGTFDHLTSPLSSYHPVRIAGLLHLPPASPALVYPLLAVLVVGCPLVAAGRAPRLAGWPVGLAYLLWTLLEMSYGKVDHDHLALLTAVLVLPTAGPARFADRDDGEAAGWALRWIQLAVIATYFLAAWAKVRFGGWDWPTGATFYWAMSRRGTGLGRLLLHAPWLLWLSQWLLIGLEALSPLLLFLRGRARLLGVVVLVGFHIVTYATLTIHFLPLVVCLAAFLSLERYRLPWGRRAVETVT